MKLFKWIIDKIKRVFYIAYGGEKLGIRYRANERTCSLIAVFESLAQGFALYAAFSEIVDKFLRLFSVSLPYMLERLIFSALGTLFCGWILFSINREDGNVYKFPRIPRIVAGFIIWPILIALIISTCNLLFAPKPYVEPVYKSSVPFSADSWKIQDIKGKGPSEIRIYSLWINNIPAEKRKGSEHMRILIEPFEGFKLLDVQPKYAKGKILKRNQEPLEVGRFENSRSEWFFLFFDDSMQWELIVKISKAKPEITFPKEAPLSAIAFLHKDQGVKV